MTNPLENMHKLFAIFGVVSIFWICLLFQIENKPDIGPIPWWFYPFSASSLGSWTYWVVKYTMIESKREETRATKPDKLWNFLHIIPMALLNFTVYKGLSAMDKAQLYFFAFGVWRYYRAIVTQFFHTQYKVAKERPQGSRYAPEDCTVIVPTVGPKDNPVFEDMVAAILWNKPKRLIFSANNLDSRADIEVEVKRIIRLFVKANPDGQTSFQKEHDLGKELDPKVVTEITYTHVDDSNKRKQTYHAIEMVKTKILLMVDDTAIWHPKFLRATLPAFDDPEVGIVGTNKRVRYERPEYDSKKNPIKNWAKWYYAGFWNTVGAQYLDRHSYETRASNTADGTVFTISGRTLAGLATIFQDDEFKNTFLNEYVLAWLFELLTTLQKRNIPGANWVLASYKKKGLTEKGFGPLRADDDNFITRWVINRGKSVKVQSSPEATMTTVLGNTTNFKYLDQCERWSRTTFRQNPIALFSDRTIWWKWPIGVWTVYFPWLYNFALFWDGCFVVSFCQSGLYQDSSSGNWGLFFLILFLWATKLIKTWRWFAEHPLDFILYFCIPAYPLLCYYHSWIKLYTALTCWNLDWTGRNIKKAEQVAGIIAGRKTE